MIKITSKYTHEEVKILLASIGTDDIYALRKLQRTATIIAASELLKVQAGGSDDSKKEEPT